MSGLYEKTESALRAKDGAAYERAIRFYRRAGCVEDAGSERTLERGGVKLVEVRYRLPCIRLG